MLFHCLSVLKNYGQSSALAPTRRGKFKCLTFCCRYRSRDSLIYRTIILFFVFVGFSSIFSDLAPQLGLLRAAAQMHIGLLVAVLRAPLTFFDTTPTGRVLSRFSKDIDVLDTGLPQQISDTVYCLFEVIYPFINALLHML